MLENDVLEIEEDGSDPIETDNVDKDDYYSEENDPMLDGLREAEAEEAAKAKSEDKTEDEDDKKSDESKDDEGKAAGGDGDDKKPRMIPIERLNEVLSERDALRDILSQQKGVIEFQSKALATKGSPDNDGKTDETQKTATEPDLNQIIETAENKKIELAAKYEDGEISYSEMVRETTNLDREIRKHETDLLKQVEKNAEDVAKQTVSQSDFMREVNRQAAIIQEQHPYVTEIDNLPQHIAAGIWGQINQEAAEILAQKGIPLNNSLESRVALMKEKAALTDKYGPQYTGKNIGKPQAKTQLSEKAQQRSDKLDIAQTQPPQLGAGVGSDSRELTPEMIENMSEDQIADFLERSPETVYRAAGIKNR